MTASRILRRLTLLPETGAPVSFDALGEYAFAEAFDVRVALDGDELRARTGYRMSALVLDTDAVERIAAWASAGVRVTAFGEGESVHVVWADPVVPSLSAPEEGEPQMLWGRRLLLSTARASAPVAEVVNLLGVYGWGDALPAGYALTAQPGPSYASLSLADGAATVAVDEGGTGTLSASILAPVPGRDVTASVDIAQSDFGAQDAVDLSVAFYGADGAVLLTTSANAAGVGVQSVTARAPAGTIRVGWSLVATAGGPSGTRTLTHHAPHLTVGGGSSAPLAPYLVVAAGQGQAASQANPGRIVYEVAS